MATNDVEAIRGWMTAQQDADGKAVRRLDRFVRIGELVEVITPEIEGAVTHCTVLFGDGIPETNIILAISGILTPKSVSEEGEETSGDKIVVLSFGERSDAKVAIAKVRTAPKPPEPDD